LEKKEKKREEKKYEKKNEREEKKMTALTSRVCSSKNRDSINSTVEQLYNSILHLATFDQWSVDDKSGAIGSNGKAIDIYAFTNREADPTGNKVYTNLYPLSEDMNLMLNSWLARHSSPPSDTGYFEKTYEDFFKNPASAYKIENWKLKRIQQVRLDPGDASREDVKVGTLNPPMRYRLTFGSAGGNYNVSLLFYPNDKIYYCKYEPKDTVEHKKRLASVDGGAAEYMEIYGQGNIQLADIPCSLEGKTELKRKKDTIGGIVNFIKSESGKSGNPWQRSSSGVWKVKDIRNGLHINYIFGYKFGVPTIKPNLGSDNAGLRVIEMREITDKLWEFTVVQENRGLFSPPKIKLYVTDNDQVSVCF
jgi:hypothetical protein